MTIRAGLLAGVVVGVSIAAAPAPNAGSIASFRTPSRNIACALYANVLRCDVLSGLRPPPRARCELDWTGVSLGIRGRARPTCAGDTVYDRRAPVLRYGESWRRRGFSCASRRTGLRCANAAGRGFELARERWRVF